MKSINYNDLNNQEKYQARKKAGLEKNSTLIDRLDNYGVEVINYMKDMILVDSPGSRKVADQINAKNCQSIAEDLLALPVMQDAKLIEDETGRYNLMRLVENQLRAEIRKAIREYCGVQE